MELLGLIVIVLVVIIVFALLMGLWFNEYKQEYITNSDEAFNDFYSLIKEKDDV